MTQTKSSVFYFLCNENVNIVKEILADNDNMFKCYGVGNKAYLLAMKQGKANQTVHQIKMHVTGNPEILYSYQPNCKK